MPPKKMMLTIAIILIVVLSVMASVQTYRIRDNADAELLWNSEEAYLFIGVASRGYRLSYLRYFVNLAKERLGGVTLPDDKHSSVVVLRLTPEAIERNAAGNIDLDSYTPLEGKIYANHQGELWKWAENHFAEASPDEKRKFDDSKRQLELHFVNLDGWSKQVSVLNRGFGQNEFPVKIHGEAFTLVVNRDSKAGVLSVDLRRAGKAPEVIWFLDEKSRRVSKTEYQRLFKKSD